MIVGQLEEEPQEVIMDINRLVQRQDELEQEIQTLRSLIKKIDDSHDEQHKDIYQRIDGLEKEVEDIREQLQTLMTKVESIESGVKNVNVTVGEINSKQDVAIEIQGKFINHLWRAFFILLGVISAAGTAIFTFTK